MNHMLCRSDSTYDILHRCVPRRITVHEVAVEVHHNDAVVLFLRERTCSCNLRGSSGGGKGGIFAKRHSRPSAGHRRERFCSGCTRWRRTNARIWREPLLSRALLAWRCERRETDRPAFQFGSSRKPSPTIRKAPLLLTLKFTIIGIFRFDTARDVNKPKWDKNCTTLEGCSYVTQETIVCPFYFCLINHWHLRLIGVKYISSILTMYSYFAVSCRPCR